MPALTANTEAQPIVTRTGNVNPTPVKVALMGVTFDSPNLGVGALLGGSISAILSNYPNAQISVLDYGYDPFHRNVRFNDRWTPDSLAAEIKRRVAAADVGGRATLTFEPTNAVAFLTKPGPFTDLVAEAVMEVTGRKPSLSTGGGTSDARFIKNACPVVELGLVNATIHAVNERVALDDLEALSRIYERALELYFAQAPA